MLPCADVGEALRYAPSGAGVLVETLRELATRGTRGKTSGEGAGARVAVRSVLEDHETAVLELEQELVHMCQKAKALWKMKAAKEVGEEYYDPTREGNIRGRRQD